ncbi:MAG: hypothetical protein WC999_15630 [Hydrogenophaga sp.]|jgi:hypothetical protein
MEPIIVQRAPGDRQGPDIISAQIRTEAQAIARGTQEINRNCSDRLMVAGAMPLSELLAPGSVVAVTDLEQGVWRGMIRAMAWTIDRTQGGLTAETSVQIERVKP